MLKALFTLDCDDCHEPLMQAAVVTEQDEELVTDAWQAAAVVLRIWAAEDGWHFHRAFHICPACLLEHQEMASAMQDEELSSTA